jgi:hypothetical protein
MAKSKSRSNAAALGGFDVATADGYSGNGLSLWTRRAAKSQQDMGFADSTPARVGKGHELPTPDLIREYEGRVRWLEAELRTETDSARRAKLTKNLEIKRRRLSELNLGGGQ